MVNNSVEERIPQLRPPCHQGEQASRLPTSPPPHSHGWWQDQGERLAASPGGGEQEGVLQAGPWEGEGKAQRASRRE